MNRVIGKSVGRYPRLGFVSVLAMVVSAGMGCSMQAGPSTESPSSAASNQFINVALGTAPTFVASTGVVTVKMNGETAEVYINAADSSLMVNGVQAIDNTGKTPVVAIAAGKTANIKSIVVNDAPEVAAMGPTTPNVLILNYINGVFGVGTLAAAGTAVSFSAGTPNSLVVKGTTGNDNFVIGANGISLTNGNKVPTKDITVAGATGVTNYDFFLGDGNDTFSSGGNTAVGAAFNKAVSIYGGNGNDTLNETAGLTLNETFSGGPGTDTVDYSSRPATSALTGTIAISSSVGTGHTLTGTNTLFKSQLVVGQHVTFAPQPTTVYKIASITSNTVAALSTAYSGSNTAATTATTDNSITAVLDSTGTFESGAGPWAVACTPGNTGEGDIILDADVILGTPGNDQLMGDVSGSATLNGEAGNDTFCQGADARNSASDTMIGGGGTDTVDYSHRVNSLTVVMDGKTLSGDPTGNSFAGEGDIIDITVANINLGSGGGSYTGNALNNLFMSNTAGSSMVYGLAGNDTLDEGPDGDNGATETYAGGDGIDTITYHSRTANLTVVMDGMTASGDPSGAEQDIINTDVENLYGGAGQDTLTGNDNDNDIEGNGYYLLGTETAGGDTLCGMAGNDTLVGNLASDDGTNTATLHGNDCLDAVPETGAFNLCVNTGTGGSPAAGAPAKTANCELVQQ
jgi:hypothetical protein